jgi:hypothetical protein
MEAQEFMLPNGVFADDGRCLRRGRLRPLGGADEEWIRSLPSGTRRPALVSAILGRLVTDIEDQALPDLIRRLTLRDRDFLLLEVRRRTFGDQFSLVLVCPRASCGAKLDLDIEVSGLPIDERPRQARHRVRVDDRDLEFRLPTGADEDLLAEGVGGDELLGGCVLAYDGPRDARALSLLATAIDEAESGVETRVDAHCPACGHEFEVDIDPAALLVGDMARARSSFDREVHLLAFHYHWPLSELLALTKAERQHYVRILAQELRRTA